MTDARKVIKVLIVDDHPLVREALVYVINKQPCYRVIGEAGDGEAAVKLATELNPDVVIIDLNLPKLNGLEATRQIKAKNNAPAILALSVNDDVETIISVIKAGADGYLTKSVIGKEVVTAIGSISIGDLVLSPDISRKIIMHSNAVLRNYPSRFETNDNILTSRESTILRLMGKGYSNKEIATTLDLSIPTVKGHLLALFAKLNVKSRTEAVVSGLRMGIIKMSDLIE